jgi:hypothetical protein
MMNKGLFGREFFLCRTVLYNTMQPKLGSILTVSHGVMLHCATLNHLLCKYPLRFQVLAALQPVAKERRTVSELIPVKSYPIPRRG